MTIVRDATHYQGGVVTVRPEDTVCKVADEMDHYAVSCVIVVDEEHVPLGVITDRDLLRRVVAPGKDLDGILAADIMTADPITGSAGEPLERILDKMRTGGVRRLPIVREGRLVGLMAIDDIVAEIGRDLGDIREALRTEVLGTRRTVQPRRRRDDVAAIVEELRDQIASLGSDSREWLQREIDAVRRRLGKND